MKVLALDMDGTAIGASEYMLPHFLTPSIVKYATDRHFDCVIFVTKRSAKNFAKDIWQYVVRWAEAGWNSNNTVKIQFQNVAVDVDREYLFSHLLGNAAQHFHRTTDIPLLTISTEDDVFLDECGRGYMSLVRHLERKLMQDLKENGYATLESENSATLKKQHGKNTQLQLIARVIHRHWPQEEVDLTFIDDIFEHGVAAQSAFADNPKVRITNLYFENSETLMPVEQVIAKRQAVRAKLFASGQFFQRALQEKQTNVKYSLKLVGSGNRFESSIEVNTIDDLHAHFGGIESLVEYVGGGNALSHVDISLEGIVDGESLREQFNTVEDYLSFVKEFLPESNDIKAVYIRK